MRETVRATRVAVTTYLLDTNTCVECSVVLGELFLGAYKSSHPAANLALVRTFAATLLSVPFDDSAADVYGRIRADLERQGQPIGPNDTMIAAIGFANGLTLVTQNIAEFSRVSGLVVESWHT